MRRSGVAGFLVPLLSFLSAALTLALVLALAPPAAAQYLYLDANGDGVHTAADVLSPSGTTTVDVYISTDHNRDGSTATCVTGDGNLTINSYEFILKAQHGTVTWGTFTNRMADFSVNLGLASSATDYHNGFGGGTILPAGLYKVATLEITPTTGTPSIVLASSTSLNGSYLTSFGSQCSGNDFDNTMKLGSEWTDVDGLPYSGPTNAAPVLAQPADMTVTESTTADQTLTATDADGNPLTFSAVQPPLFVTVTTTDPGTGTATGNLHLAPNASDVGTRTLRVQATDGFDIDEKQFQITVDLVQPPKPPMSLQPIPDVELRLLQQASIPLHVNDPDGTPLTFEKTTGPDFMSLITQEGGTYVEIAPTKVSEVGVWPASVTARDLYTSDTKSFTIYVSGATHSNLYAYPHGGYVGQPVTADVVVNDPDNIPLVSLTVDASDIPQGDNTSFTVSADKQYGTFTWIPSAVGPHTIGFAALDVTGYTATATTTVIAYPLPPHITAPDHLSIHPGDAIDFTVTASDPYSPIVSLTADYSHMPPNHDSASFTVNATNTEGHFTWTPQPEDFLAGQYFYYMEFFASDGTDPSGALGVVGCLTVFDLNVNRPPVANAGGPYSGVAGVAIMFDGTGSSDPDGDPLTYSWNFGDSVTGAGATISHVYTAGGDYPASVTVTDPSGLQNTATTQVPILAALPARAYAPAGQTTVRLASAKPLNSLEIEPLNADFEVGDVDLSTIQLHSNGTGSVDAIAATAGKTAVVSDRDQNGVLEIQASFAKADFRRLFDAMAPGQHDVTVGVDGKVASGARFTASLALRVIVNGTLTASISPNPMNPEAVLTFRTSREGPVRAVLYDLSGRRVRTLLDAGGVEAGYHDVRIDGTTDSGGRLASGIYFVAIESVDGEIRSKVTILR